MDYQIRKSTSSDESELKRLIKEFKLFESAYESKFRTDDDAVNELYESEMIGDGNHVHVVQLSNSLVGFVAFKESTKNDPLIVEPIPVVYVVGIYIEETHRSKGLAVKLMDIVKAFAKSKNIKFLKLVMFTKNQTAKSFYDKYGFEDYEVTMIKELD
jgi:ribosomal protein S18 acetylase RimI-like enzyme